jgi:hypothetical protein
VKNIQQVITEQRERRALAEKKKQEEEGRKVEEREERLRVRALSWCITQFSQFEEKERTSHDHLFSSAPNRNWKNIGKKRFLIAAWEGVPV